MYQIKTAGLPRLKILQFDIHNNHGRYNLALSQYFWCLWEQQLALTYDNCNAEDYKLNSTKLVGQNPEIIWLTRF